MCEWRAGSQEDEDEDEDDMSEYWLALAVGAGHRGTDDTLAWLARLLWVMRSNDGVSLLQDGGSFA